MDPTVVKAQLQDVEKLENFNGPNYKQWSMKIFYQLTIAKVAYVLSEAYSQDDHEQSNREISANRKKWLEDDYVSKFMILNDMSNSVFNVFHTHVTANSLWNALQQSYVNEDAGNKSFLVNKDGLDNHGKNDIHTIEASSSKGFKSKKKFNKKEKGSLNEKKNVDHKPMGNDFKKKRGPCFARGKMGHLARDCCHHKGKKSNEANVLDDDMIGMLT
ncbi:hypothetical protein ACH5RR_029324 [Cinchona calisaya]|uniref:Uncharacterized protein n=1 Tax=Cinchona calisaya TaxID=153742 RepID=A0ABD2YRE3_9GENT